LVPDGLFLFGHEAFEQIDLDGTLLFGGEGWPSEGIGRLRVGRQVLPYLHDTECPDGTLRVALEIMEHGHDIVSGGIVPLLGQEVFPFLPHLGGGGSIKNHLDYFD